MGIQNTINIASTRVGKNPGFLQKTQPTGFFFFLNPMGFLKKPGFNVFFFFNLSGYLKEMSQKANLLK